ncbi:MAG: L-histidine N(alpha)-methyltransferase [Myxococcota bacterium]
MSAQALEDCKRTLEQLDGVHVDTVEAPYVQGLARVAKDRMPGTRRLVLFLGSNLSNFDRAEALAFLRDVRAQLVPGDALLLATDLDKQPERLLPAYDDPLGVTAAFDKNLLVRLNREWGADFPLDAFVHRAKWNAAGRRVEMHLEATRALEVRVAALELTVRFEQGETIWTESSHRFSVEELRAWAVEAGFEVTQQWVDAEWPFAQSLLIVPSKEKKR